MFPLAFLLQNLNTPKRSSKDKLKVPIQEKAVTFFPLRKFSVFYLSNINIKKKKKLVDRKILYKGWSTQKGSLPLLV